MIVNILHCPDRKDRYELLLKEIEQQKFEYRIWECVKEFPKPKQNISESHKMIIRFAKENNMEECCVMEDDAHFTAPNSIEYFLRKKPQDYDVYLGGIEWGRLNGDNTVDDFAGLNFYIIHQKFYDTFLSADRNKDIDRAIGRKGKFVVVNPFCVIQHETVSDNRRKVIHRNAKLYFNRSLYNGTNG